MLRLGNASVAPFEDLKSLWTGHLRLDGRKGCWQFPSNTVAVQDGLYVCIYVIDSTVCTYIHTTISTYVF